MNPGTSRHHPVNTAQSIPMQISDIMTPNPKVVQPDDTLQYAARLMDELNVGVLPVTQEDRLVGMLTDRDMWSDRHPSGRIHAGRRYRTQ
jgi:predicted transcriptional regulator